MNRVHYNDLVFDANLLFAQRDGEVLRFTRQERAMLEMFTQNPRRLLSRTHILDAIATPDAPTSDRNVDFLVNRLRAKLGDKAREPRFIATQYGEGYIWIAERIVDEPLAAFLLIGPLYGLFHEPTRQIAEPLLRDVSAAFDALTGPGQTSVVAESWRRAAPHRISFSLDASLHCEGDVLHAAVLLRDGASGRMLHAWREVLRPGADDAENAAARIKDAIWRHLVGPDDGQTSPAALPLELRLHEAALILAGTPESHREIEGQMARERFSSDDPALGILQALGQYARLVQAGPALSPEQWDDIEDEIERLVQAGLPAAQDDPLLMLAAAKLLFFIDRGHFEFAEQLAEEAFANSPAFAASFAMRAQILMCRGKIEEAVVLYDKAIELAGDSQEFTAYLLVLKCTALLAAADRRALDATCAELFTLKPESRFTVGIFLADHEGPPPPECQAILAGIDEPAAARLAHHLYRVGARHFRASEHRDNVMRGLLARLAHFDPDAVQAPVREFLTRSPARRPPDAARS